EKKRSTYFRSVLDSYIENKFSSISAHKHLMTCVKSCFDEVERHPKEISKVLLPTLKVKLIFHRKLTCDSLLIMSSSLSLCQGFYSRRNKLTRKICGSNKTYKVYSIPFINS